MTTTLTPQPSTYIDPADRPVVRHIGLARTAAQSATMGYRGLLKLRHNPEQLTDVVLLPVIFTLMFSYIFGGAVAGDGLDQALHGLLAELLRDLGGAALQQAGGVADGGVGRAALHHHGPQPVQHVRRGGRRGAIGRRRQEQPFLSGLGG